MASKNGNPDNQAFLDAALGLLAEERTFSINGHSILLEEPSGKECEDANVQFLKLAKLSGQKGGEEKRLANIQAWYLGLIKRVLPDEVLDAIGEDNLARFVIATGGWRGDLAKIAARLHGVPVSRPGEEDNLDERGNPANPS